VTSGVVADFLFYVTAATYVVASVLFLRYLVRGTGERGERFAPRLVAIGAGMHAAHIVVSSLVLRVCPVEGIHFPMSVASMFMCVAYLFGRARYRVEVAGAFVAPLALTSLLASRFVGVSEPDRSVRNVLLPFHVTMNLVGVALFALAFSSAALYLVQERLVKKKRIDGVSRRLPPLDALDRAEHRFLLAGFPLLTIGIITGTVWAGRVESGYRAEVLRAVFGYVTWLVIAGVLFLRAAAGWRGRRAAYGTITGFAFSVVVLVIYLVRGRAAPAPTADAPHAANVVVTTGAPR
jgi:ABC-type uncharacterized transport system permease subunit